MQVPTANAIFFNGDRVEGTCNPVIERLSDIQNIAEILVSKLGPSINTWVIEASTFNGPFAVYKVFIQSLNQWGEPQSYRANGYPASTSVITLLSNFLIEVASVVLFGILYNWRFLCLRIDLSWLTFKLPPPKTKIYNIFPNSS